MEIAVIIICSVLVLFLASYLFAIGTKRSKALKAYAGHRYAHRGLHSEGVAENSMTAFARAVEGGYGIELDVRLSKDKQLVVFHDDTLDRVVGIEGKVSDYTASELSSMKLLGTGDTVPLFDDVLNLVSGRVPLLVEIKENAGDSEVSTLLSERMQTYKGDYIVESFNPLSLRNVKKHLDSVECGILSHKYLAYKPYRKPLYFLLQCMLFNFLCRPSFVAYDHKHYKSLSLLLTRKLFGAVCFAWTVKSGEDEALARRHGFDTVIFEGYIPE